MITRIICVGNRYAADDEVGPRTYEILAGRARPAEVEVVEGGLAGLNLLGLMEGVGRVVLVDTLAGFTEPGQVVMMDGIEAGLKISSGYGHGNGLGYLLRMLPTVWEGKLPEIIVIGLEGRADAQAINRLAETCLELAVADQGARTPAGTVSRGSSHGTSH